MHICTTTTSTTITTTNTSILFVIILVNLTSYLDMNKLKYTIRHYI